MIKILKKIFKKLKNYNNKKLKILQKMNVFIMNCF